MKIPGFIDLQINGYKGIDFSNLDLTEEKFIHACQELFRAGTAAFLPTVVTSPEEVYGRNLPLIAKVLERKEFQNHLLGIHIEGPFISPQFGAMGTHNAKYICKPSIDYLKKLQTLANGHVKLLTIAAELEESEKLTKYASQSDIVVSLGHQQATAEDINQLAEAGACSLTHFGNGLPNEIDRHNNPIWPALANDELTAMIITDGHHLPDAMIKTIIRAKGTTGVIITSDLSPIAGQAPGTYEFMGREVILKENGLIYSPATESLAASSSTMFECMNYLASLELLSEEELFRVGFYNPLELIDVEASRIKSDISVCFNQKKNVFEII